MVTMTKVITITKNTINENKNSMNNKNNKKLRQQKIEEI